MIGERLGNWTILKELGQGGMGSVWLAQEIMGERKAAVKKLNPDLATDKGFLERFKREIEALGQLDHPNIVRFYDAGQDNNIYYYAMEYVEGQSLEDALLEQGRLPWQEVLDIAIQICPPLRHVHDHGIIHRDLKPPNILRSTTGQIKLTDFGIAKVFASTHLTATGGVVGTAEFLSPEQASGKPVSKRSDLYSLGIVLYTLLTGRHPFEGTSFVELLHKHRYGQFDRPSRLVPGIPYEVDDIICQLLEKDPAKRPPDCLVLGKQLEALRRKLDRKSHPTADVVQQDATIAENRSDFGEEFVGPSTLMSRLMRAEIERQKQHGPLGRLLNRAWVLSLLLVLCIGTIVWAFWPPSAETLFERGSKLMSSDSPADWNRAWTEYLEPLAANYPDNPYQQEIAVYREKIDAARRAAEVPSEAERFFQHGERLRRERQYAQAKQVWLNLVEGFAGVEAEKKWVERTRQSLTELDKIASAPERWTSVRQALKQAAALRDEGKADEAEQIWSAIENLYRDDPWGRPILDEVALARKKTR